MKNRINRVYWVVTALMGAFMLMASIPDVLRFPQAVEIFGHLGYPAYLLPLLGTAKIGGVIAVLTPGLDRLKEWAYAGLVFDITGALEPESRELRQDTAFVGDGVRQDDIEG